MSWLGDLVGVVVAAPVRIINLPVKLIEASMGDASTHNTLDAMADGVETSVKKVVDGNEFKAA